MDTIGYLDSQVRFVKLPEDRLMISVDDIGRILLLTDIIERFDSVPKEEKEVISNSYGNSTNMVSKVGMIDFLFYDFNTHCISIEAEIFIKWLFLKLICR